MATAKARTARPAGPPRRRRRRLALLGLALLAGLVAWFWGPLNGRAEAGAAYGARVACACRHVAGRALDDCRKDFLSGMGPVMLSEDKAERSVTATFPLLARQTATFRPGEGCLLESWED